LTRPKPTKQLADTYSTTNYSKHCQPIQIASKISGLVAPTV